MYTKKYWRTNYEEMSIDWVKGRLVEKNIFNTLKSLFLGQTINLWFMMNLDTLLKVVFLIFLSKNLKIQFNLNHNVNKIDIKNKLIHFKNGKSVNYNIFVSSIPLTEYKNLLVTVPSWVLNYLETLKYTKLITYNYKLKRK